MKKDNASCMMNIAIVSTCCTNPGFNWVSALYSDTAIDKPKIFLLQRAMDRSASVGLWCMPSEILGLPIESTDMEICLTELREKLGDGIFFNASPDTLIHTRDIGDGKKYFGGSWDALPGGIKLKPYKDQSNPFTGYGWFTAKEITLLSMSDPDKIAAFKVLSDPKKYVILQSED